jgi:hypothetical protein
VGGEASIWALPKILTIAASRQKQRAFAIQHTKRYKNVSSRYIS